MSRQRLIMGNWKMHGTQASIHALLEHLKTICLTKSPKVDVAVFPPFVYLESVLLTLRHFKVRVGAQDVSMFKEGASTGEVSANMLKDIGCQYVIIGHSERRQKCGETEKIIVEKYLRASEAGLKPILCVGETAEQYSQEKTEEIVLAQLQSVLNLCTNENDQATFVVAYEPVWAIGTGLTATPEHAQNVHRIIRQAIAKRNEALSQRTSILYGGSVKAENAEQLFSMPDIDGALVGGASLIGEEFKRICDLAELM